MVNNHQEEASMEKSTLVYIGKSILSSHFKNKRKVKYQSKKSLGKSRKAPLGCKRESISAPSIKSIKIIEGSKNQLLHALGPNPPNPHTSLPFWASFPHVIINNIQRSFDLTIPRCLDSQETDSVLHEVHDSISRGYFSGLRLATNLEWVLWIHQISVVDSIHGRFNFNIQQ